MKAQFKKSLLSKTLLALLTLALLLGGCQAAAPASTAPSGAPGAPVNADKIKTVGIIQLLPHTSLNIIRDSILAEFKALGYTEENLKIDVRDGQGDPTIIANIAQKFVGDKVDVIIAIATPAAQIAINTAADSGIPVVFSAVSDPATDLAITNLAAPEGITTGTCDLIPVDSTLALAKQINPNLSKIGLLYNSGEANSVSVIKDAKAYCQANGIEFEEATVAVTSDLAQVASALASKVDAIFTPIDNSIADAMPILAQIGIDAKVPIYVGADSMVMDGGFAAVGINYEDLGTETARMADALLKGKSVSEIPVHFFDDFSTYINSTTQSALGLDVPQDVLDKATLFQ